MPSSDSGESAIRLVVGLLRPHQYRIALAIVFAVLACVLALPMPVLVQRLVDGATTASAVDLAVFAGLLVGSLLLQAACGWAAAILIGGAAIDAGRVLRRNLYERLVRDELNLSPGMALARLTDDVACIQNLVSVQTVGLITDLGTAAMVAGYLLWQSPVLFAATIVFVPAALLHFRYYSGRIEAASLDVRGQLDRIFVQLQEKLDGALIVKAHGREAHEETEFAGKMAAAHEPRMHLGRLGFRLSLGSQLLAGVGATAVFAVAVWGVSRGQMTPGQAISAAALAALFFGPLTRLADVTSVFQQAAASARRLAEMNLPNKKAIADPDHPAPLGRAHGLIEFEGVGFAYEPGVAVLADLSLRVEPGEHIAVVGPTGCGKSTLLGLLLRFQDPNWGDVRLDGYSLRQLSQADLRRQFGFVPQDPIVFRGSLADNIRFGCPEANMERVMEAAAAAGVDRLADRWPEGYDTIVGDGGQLLSAGERQRIAIARAICLDPPIVLLDEATSHLDPFAEEEVQAALGRLLAGRTAIIVAHRLSTIRDVDRVVLLSDGRVVKHGRPDEVLPSRSLVLALVESAA